MRFRVDGHTRHLALDGTGQRVEQANRIDLAIEQLHTHRLFIGVGGEDIDHVAADAISTAPKIHIITGVLQLSQTTQEGALVDQLTSRKVKAHL